MDVIDIGAVLGLTGEQITAAMETIPSAYTYKGSVASVDDLPESGNEEGDLYTVGGIEYVWDGTTWVAIKPEITTITDAQIDALFT